MKKYLKKIIIVFLVVATLGAMIASLHIPAYAAENKTTKSSTKELTKKASSANDNLNDKIKEKGKIELWFGLEKSKPTTKDAYKAAADFVDALEEEIPNIKKLIDGQNGGDFDTAALLDTISSIYSGMAHIADIFVPGLGSLCSAVVDLRHAIFKAAMGGEEATSETQQMLDSINQSFDDIRDRLSIIDEELAELSNQIDASTQKILDAVPSMLDDQSAKEELGRFMSMGEGNFSYSQYRNYLYGTIENNPRGNTAYYALLNEALENEESDRIIKIYQDNLYKVLTDNRTIFYNYIDPDSATVDSIIKTYYKVVSANPQLLENDDSPELATIKFAYDLRQTMLKADIALRGVLSYQKAHLEDDIYKTNTGEEIPASLIEETKEALLAQDLAVYDRMICEIANVLGLTDSFVVENKGEFYYVEANEGQNSVLKGQTVYLNKMDGSLCQFFGLEESSFRYVCSNYYQTNGIFTPDSNGEYVFDFYYCTVTNEVPVEKKIGSIKFIVGDETTAVTGSGTSEDPYLISTAQQFSEIRNGLDKNYKLIKDINFTGYSDFTPIGYYLNTSGNEACKEFTGTIDGNGYKISNLTISGNYLRNGVIAKLGESGVVTNLTFENVTISSDISVAKASNSKFYIGTIAAENNGTIKFCNVTSDDNQTYGLFFTLDNKAKNKCIEVYAGGICGLNKCEVLCCWVDNIKNKVDSTHNFGGDATEKNTHSAYIGGLVGGNQGYINYSLVGSGAQIEGRVKSVYNPQTTVNPYLTVFAGGVCGIDCTGYEGIEMVCSMIGTDQIICKGILDCKSNWGTYYKNFKSEKHPYIPEISEADQNKISTSQETIETLCADTNSAFSVQYANGTNIDLANGAYSLSTDHLKKSGFQLLFDGAPVDFTILHVYDFDGRNEDLENESFGKATVLLCATLSKEQTILTKQTVNYRIAKNKVEKVTVTPAETTYYTGDELSLAGAGLYIEYIVGNEETTITNSTDYTVTGFSTDTVTGLSENRSYTITYCGIESNLIKYYVLCEHLRNNAILVEGEPVSATCCSEGYTPYHCNKCGEDIWKNYTPITNDHKVAYAPGEDPTCYKAGSTSRVYCEECGIVFVEEYEIPKKSHHFVAVDDIYHRCNQTWNGVNCTCTEQHQYQITPGVEKINNQYYYVYDYVCAGCGYSKRVVDTNTLVEENLSLPTVIVSNGYALNGGDEVTVYVQLVNNPGVSSANFGIKYDSNLVLLEYEDGSVLAGSWTSDSKPTENGYNFVWGNAGTRNLDGNLLKLVFKVPYEFQSEKSFAISVVYDLTDSDGNLSTSTFKQSSLDGCVEFDKYTGNGGFVTKNNKKKMFVTIDGSITFVKHLPGDVNCDNVVDILDAIEIGKHLVHKIQLSNKVADLDLNGVIDVVDLTVLLQTLNGGYGTSLSNPTFDLLINLNGAETEELNGADLEALKQMVISLYNDSGNQTYGDYGLINLERTGYKFDGWYTRIAIDESIDPKTGKPKEKWEDYKVELNDGIQYNSSQKRQTLYAHWTLNQIYFDVTDATSGAKESVCYVKGSETQQKITDSDVKQEYTILLQDKDTYHWNEDGSLNKGNSEPIDCSLSYKIDCWKGSDGKYYTFDAQKSGEDYVDDEKIHHTLIYLKDITIPNLGNLSLTAIWDDGELESFDFSNGSWDLTGYQIDSVRWYRPNSYGNYIINLETFEVTLDNHDQLKALAKQDNDKHAYLCAIFDPITYTITFTVNGNSGSSLTPETNHTIENSVSIESAEHLQKTGYKLPIEDGVVWKDNFGNTYTNRQLVGYINGVNNGETVTFTAQWVPITYQIEYDLQGGSFGTNHPNQATYNDEVTISKPTRAGYTFTGWKVTNCSDGAQQYATFAKYKEILGVKILVGTYQEWAPVTSQTCSKVVTEFKNLRTDNTASVKFTATWKANDYDLTFDNSQGGLLTNVNKSSTLRETLGVVYDSSTKEYQLTSYDSTDSYCTIEQAVYLVANRNYYIHVNPTFNSSEGRLQVFYGINRGYVESRSFHFSAEETKTFTVDQDGAYSIRFDLDYCTTATLKDFWISDVPASKNVTFGVNIGIDYAVLSTYAPTGYFSSVENSKEGVLCKVPSGITFHKSPTDVTVYFDKNGGSGGTSSVSVTYGENGRNNVTISAPTRSGYIFTGYYANTGTVGSGVLYWVPGQTELEVWDNNIWLYAHWVKDSTTTQIRDGGHETVRSDNTADRLVTEDNSGVWDWGEGHATSGYSASEISELQKVGYKYFKVDVDIDVQEPWDNDLCWVWIAVRIQDKNDMSSGEPRLISDINIFKLGIDSILRARGKDENAWVPSTGVPDLHLVTRTISINALDTSGYEIGLYYGATGKGKNAWYVGTTSIKFIPTKESSSAKIVADGAGCAENWWSYSTDYAAIK